MLQRQWNGSTGTRLFVIFAALPCRGGRPSRPSSVKGRSDGGAWEAEVLRLEPLRLVYCKVEGTLLSNRHGVFVDSGTGEVKERLRSRVHVSHRGRNRGGRLRNECSGSLGAVSRARRLSRACVKKRGDLAGPPVSI